MYTCTCTAHMYCTVVEMVKSSSDNNEKRLMGEWVQWKNAIGKVYETIEEEIER